MMTREEVDQGLSELKALGLIKQVGVKRCPTPGKLEPLWDVDRDLINREIENKEKSN